MTADEVREIVLDRLARWAPLLSNAHATPVVLVGVGHDHARGEIQVVTVDDEQMRAEVIAGFLLSAVDKLRRVDPAAQPDPQWTRGTLTAILEHLRTAHTGVGPGGCTTCEQFVRGLGAR